MPRVAQEGQEKRQGGGVMGRLIILLPFIAVAVVVFLLVLLGKGIVFAAKVGSLAAQSVTFPARASRQWLIDNVGWKTCLRCGAEPRHLCYPFINTADGTVNHILATCPLCPACEEMGCLEARNNANSFHLSVISLGLRRLADNFDEFWPGAELLADYYEPGDMSNPQKNRVLNYHDAVRVAFEKQEAEAFAKRQLDALQIADGGRK